MKIGGFQKFSIIEYPGKVSCIVFTQGCNFKCPYCYNKELLDEDLFGGIVRENEVFEFLKLRKNRLDAVVVSGGEPTLQQDLAVFAEKIKQMGFLVKINTNGSHPETIKALINKRLIDYIAMDIKAPYEKYQKICGSAVDPERVKESVSLIRSSGIEYEFRTTLASPLLNLEDIGEIVRHVNEGEHYHVNIFRGNAGVLDQSLLSEKQYTAEEIKSYMDRMKKEQGNLCAK